MRKLEIQNGYDTIPPAHLLQSPRANQLEYLDRVHHVSEPDIEAFVDCFYINTAAMPDCDLR